MEIQVSSLFKSISFEVDLDPFTTKYCLSRLKVEGYKFWTVTLPKLSKAVLKSLEKGYFERPTDFAWKGKSLRYFRSFLNKIFDPNTGLVLPCVDSLALYSLRQLCDYLYKLSLSTESQQAEAEVVFVTDELELAPPYDHSFVDTLRVDFENEFQVSSRAELRQVFRNSPPRPGPGSFAGAIGGCPWWRRKYFDDCYSPEFSAFSGHFRYSPTAPTPLKGFPLDCSEVLFVPKDSRGPRTIVREPFLRLKGQMAFFDFFSKSLSTDSRGQINFHDQQRNRSVALASSISKRFATMDLKSASDRVRFDVMLHIARNSPAIRWFLLNGRSKRAKLPTFGDITLRKVAGMGSGLTFPLMSLLIYLVAVRSVSDYLRIPYKKAMMLCGTFGDDLYCPSSCYDRVSTNLQKVGLKVNTDKSFRWSHFRESCGGDYYNGQDVAPVRLKLSSSQPAISGGVLRSNNKTYPGFFPLQLERHCRELVKAGLLKTAEVIYRAIERSYGKLPLVSGDSPALGRYTLDRDKVLSTLEVDGTGMYKTVRCLVPIPVSEPKVSTDHYHVYGRALMRSSGYDNKRDLVFYEDGSAKREVTIPHAVTLKRARISGFKLAS